MEKKSTELVSLNSNLFDEMYLQKLEMRLETDPLVPNGLMDLMGNNLLGECTCDDHSVFDSCTCDGGSHYVECTCHGGQTYYG